MTTWVKQATQQRDLLLTAIQSMQEIRSELDRIEWAQTSCTECPTCGHDKEK